MVYNGWLAAVPPCVGRAGWLFGGMGSSRRGSDSPSCSRTPQRTVRETFTSYGSNVSDAGPVSLRAAQRLRGFYNMQALMVYLIMTFGVQQHQVVVRIFSTEVFGLDMVSVPSGGFGNRLTAVCAFARLLFVKIRQHTSPGEFSGHFST